ncbi:hypothetical protein L3Q82_016972, partial [Scortum barcoo]
QIISSPLPSRTHWTHFSLPTGPIGQLKMPSPSPSTLPSPHLDQRDTYVRMLFIDYSSAFNTIVPSKLITKLRDLGLNSALCDWILNFLTGRPQAVRMGSTTSSTLTLNTNLADLHDRHWPDHQHISEDLTWTHHTDFITKSARQQLFFLRRLRRLNMDSRILLQLLQLHHREYPGLAASPPGTAAAPPSTCKALQRVVKAAQHITRTELPSMEDLYTQRCRKKATKIIKDPSHPATNCSACCRLADGFHVVPHSIRARTTKAQGQLHTAGHKTFKLSLLGEPGT